MEKPDKADQVRQLKGQVRQLQKSLGKARLEKVMNEVFLQIACERLGMDVAEFEKKRLRSGPR